MWFNFSCLDFGKLEKWAAESKACVGRVFLVRSDSIILLLESVQLSYYPCFGEKKVMVCFKRLLYRNVIQ